MHIWSAKHSLAVTAQNFDNMGVIADVTIHQDITVGTVM
jgi:hypothetical protein